MKARFTVLSENSVVRPLPLLGEHGFAVLVERGEEKVLFDTGQGYALLHNARILGADLGRAGKVVLSHGHSDHTGGLAELLKAHGSRIVFAHPGIFVSRHWRTPDGGRHAIGLPFSRSYLEGLGAVFDLSADFRPVAPGFWATGEIPRVTPFETGDGTLYRGEEDGGGPDPHPDDLSLVVEGEEGLVVVLGCAHAGIVNILRHVQARFPGGRIAAVLGGTHLGFAPEEQMAGTLSALREMGVSRIGAAHCTGLAGACRLRQETGDRFFFAGVGAVLES